MVRVFLPLCTVNDNDIYLHWKSFAPNAWKRGALRALVLSDHAVCSTKELLDNHITTFKMFLSPLMDIQNSLWKSFQKD